MLNEKIFDNKSRISEIPILTGMIGMIIFLVEEKAMIFEYSGNSFSMIFSNDREFEDVELEVRGKVGIGDDVEFTSFGDRRFQKGEYVLEHNYVQLVKSNYMMERKECNLIEMDLNLFVGKTNIRTKMVCFDGWNRKGLISHISKMMDMKSGLFDIYVDT
jgi:hypothetical protein